MARQLKNQLILVILLLVLEGCSHPTFNVNLGGPPEEPAAASVKLPCYPVRPVKSTAEFGAHGYKTGQEPEWRDTHKWFEDLGHLHQQLPDCPAKE